mmetsp:Transcript_19458/g.35213  ORF Transcript_19458/g.35213 Transcript_19458/m.35213 type:complete len:799 (-) Transcript_19458:157-2553(-)
MGNSQSTGKPCPSNPLCRALCWSPAPSAKDDDGEWFGDLPRNKKQKKKSRSQKNLTKMPVVPEESVSPGVSSDTIETSEENGTTLGGDAGSDAKSSIFSQSLSALDGRSSASKPLPRRSSDPSTTKGMKKTKTRRQPKVKLTFVNGQFVDLSTQKGQEIVKAASSEEATGAIGGILTSFNSGHCGILGPSPLSGKEKSNSVKSLGMMSSFGGSMRRTRSDGSATSISSVESSFSASSQDSAPSRADLKDAVSSIVALGDGRFLTASKSDRVIKMWRIEKIGNKSTIEFVRDFVGHSTGITCLAKVDDKGRFLSASKDRIIKIWDSRFNCDDDDDNAHQFLLATFDNMDRRSIHGIAITEDGSYVRPTDNIDIAMAAAMTKKAMKDGSASVQKAAQERQIIACSCEFATISGRHNVVKVWSMKHVEQKDQLQLEGENVAEVKVEQELKHDAVVESIASARRKGIILTGDRMGNVRLWRSAKNVFLPGTSRVWSCVRTFSWRLKSELSSVEETMQFAITSMSFLQGDTLFVSGSKSGNLRVWKVDGTKTNGETVNKEVICITGAHNLAITAVQQGPRVKENGDNTNLSFSSAAEDGKVLSFAIPVAKIGSCNPCCFNVVNHGIANRYLVDAEPISVSALGCLNMPNDAKDMLVTGSTDNGSINLLKSPNNPKQGPQRDALLLYRQAMEEESLTLYAIAEKICNGGVESRNRKLQMTTYKDVFVGKDAVSYLVDNGHAASRNDAVDLGCVLATHLSLFECATKKGKPLEDDTKSYYRWSMDSSEKGQLRKRKTEPNAERQK